MRAGYFFAVPHFYIFCIMLFLILIIIMLKFSKLECSLPYVACSLFVISFIFGFWRYNLALSDYSDTAKIYHYSSSSVEFIGRVKNIDSRLAGQKLTVQSELLQKESGLKNISGRVLISAPLYPEYQINEKIRVKCYLEKPGMIEDFDYGKYLAKENIFATCSFADLSSISLPSSYSFAAQFYRFKRYLALRLNASVSEPEVSLLRGILLGDGRGLPEDKAKMFSDLGLTHIIAISGDHIAIVAAALLQLLMLFGLSRIKAFWPLAAIIGLYVLLVGAPASAVRAAIMALSVMYAQKIGRASQIKNVLVLTAAVMILFNPRILLGDVGFQLSFMAVWGLSYISPLWATFLQKMPSLFKTKEILTATLSAQIATLPLLLFYFGKLSIISIAANILILPVIPLLTIWGLANLSVSAIYLPLGRIMGYVSWLLCAYWIKISELLHQVPFGFFNLGNFGLVELVLLYVLIFGLYYLMIKRNKNINFASRPVLTVFDK
ncbi:MAG: ComEC/Rec2 family competence protein [Candidatus Buchananbacteria bacterium]